LIQESEIKRLIAEHGTPLFVVDHDEIRPELRRVQEAVAAGAGLLCGEGQSRSAIVRTLYDAGGSFDVASMPEFQIVYEYIKDLPPRSGRTTSGTRSSTPTRSRRTKRSAISTCTSRLSLRQFRGDRQDSQARPARRLALRLSVPNTGAMVELSSKFGAASGEACS